MKFQNAGEQKWTKSKSGFSSVFALSR